MSVEQTLSIIKPDGVQKNLLGEIYSRFEKAGLQIVAAKMLHLTQADAEGFYAVHKERPFYNDLVMYMTSGSVMTSVPAAFWSSIAIIQARSSLLRNSSGPISRSSS